MNTHQSKPIVARALAVAVSACLLAACAGTPKRPPELVRLESELSRLQSDPMVAGNASQELSEARRAISVIAEDGRRMKSDLYDHNVYIASRLLQIAEAEGRATGARMRSDALASEREGLVADARTLEADRARRDAENARHAAEQAQMAAGDATREADYARRQAEAERLAAEQARMNAGDATRDAEIARAQAEAERVAAEAARAEANAAQAELQAMRQMLADLEAKQTERGLVVTLGDVLFETDRAELKPGAERNLDKLVAALREHDDTTVAIEGHTDSTGSSSYNVDLSQRRAQSVTSYLDSHGVAPARLTTRGLGEDYPVASNDNPAGRQQNRRVEIVIQNLAAAR
jgi:outer membrane protein OmpA-like peptidoglycan-associated protein